MRVPRLVLRNRLTGQALRFVIVGVVNTVVDMGAFFLLGLVPGLSIVAAKFISYNVGTANSFVLNKYWTFGAGRSKRGMREFGVFFAVNAPPPAVVTTAWTSFGSCSLAFRGTSTVPDGGCH